MSETFDRFLHYNFLISSYNGCCSHRLQKLLNSECFSCLAMYFKRLCWIELPLKKLFYRVPPMKQSLIKNWWPYTWDWKKNDGISSRALTWRSECCKISKTSDPKNSVGYVVYINPNNKHTNFGASRKTFFSQLLNWQIWRA